MRGFCRRTSLTLIFLAILIAHGQLLGQEVLEHPGEKYQVTSRTVEVENTPEGRVSRLSGGVTITHGTATITAQSGRVVEARDMAVLEGEVRIVDGETEISANTGEYYRYEKKAHLHGSVDIQDGRTSVQADDLVYYRQERVALGTGSVSFKDLGNDITVEGGEGKYEFLEGHGIMTRNPVLTAPGEKQILITGQVMEVFRKEGRALVKGEVKVYQGDWTGSCDSLVYISQEEVADLLGSPVITEEKNTAGADKLRLIFENRRLKEAVLSPNAYAVYHVGEGEINLVFGDGITIDFTDGKATHIRVRGSARGVYYLKPRGD